jgi:hypothetical protein
MTDQTDDEPGWIPFRWLAETRTLQEETYLPVAYGVGDFAALNPAQLANYWTFNLWAAVDELSEFSREVRWKPWARDGGHVKDRAKAIEEIVDALHFVGNLLVSIDATDDELWAAYAAKMERNRRRQDLPGGYDGVGAEDGLDVVSLVLDPVAEAVTPYEQARINTYDGAKDLIRCRAVASFWAAPEISVSDVAAGAAAEPASYTLHEVSQRGGTIYVDASYVGGGSNATQIRRYAAALAQHAHLNIQEHDVTLVHTLDVTVLKKGTQP